MDCPGDFELVNDHLGRVLTQYRESPKLLHLLRTYLRQIEIAYQAICDLPSFFDIDNAVGEQLTLLGKRMGFPREHCVCDVQPVFGFDCPTDEFGRYQIYGFCTEAQWVACADFGISSVRINDDETYRAFLKVRSFQIMNYYDLKSLTQAVKLLWGETAKILDRGNGRVVIAPGRPLSDIELSLIQVYPRVLPVALGIAIRFHFDDTRVFGFGEGWGGFCEGASDGEALLTEAGEPLLTEEGEPLLADGAGPGAPWMCQIDVRPYAC